MKKMMMIFLSFMILAGCKKSENAEISSGKSLPIVKSVSTTDQTKSEDTPTSEKSADKERFERRLIKTGTITYAVADFKGIENNVESKVKEFGGYIFSTGSTLNNLSIQIKVPYDRFDEFLNISGTFGKIESKNISIDDVTMNYYDLEGRIKTKKILQQRLQSYLSSAKNIEDLMKIERELNNVTSEIESIEGEFKNLSYMIAYSTLHLNFYIMGKSASDRNLPSVINSLKDFGYSLSYFFIILLIIVLSMIGFGVPIIIIIALLYYLTFGKLGLVRKLFRILSEKK